MRGAKVMDDEVRRSEHRKALFLCMHCADCRSAVAAGCPEIQGDRGMSERGRARHAHYLVLGSPRHTGPKSVYSRLPLAPVRPARSSPPASCHSGIHDRLHTAHTRPILTLFILVNT